MSDHDTTTTPEPRRRKTWFARHKILTGILAVLAVFVVGGALSGGDDAPSTAAQTSAEPAHASAGEGTGPSAGSQGSTADGSAADDAATEDEDDAADEKAADEKKAEEEDAAEKEEAAEAVPGIGDTVEVGDFSVRVTDVEPGVEWVGDSTFGEAPQGQFVKVYVTVENTGTEADYFLDSEQKLVDDQDRQHSTSSAAWMLDEESLFLTEINPGNKVEGVLLYDVPVDAVPVAVDLQAGWLSTPVRVALDG